MGCCTPEDYFSQSCYNYAEQNKHTERFLCCLRDNGVYALASLNLRCYPHEPLAGCFMLTAHKIGNTSRVLNLTGLSDSKGVLGDVRVILCLTVKTVKEGSRCVYDCDTKDQLYWNFHMM